MIYTGGGERIVLGHLEGLKKLGYKVSCVTPVLDKKRCYPDIINKYPIHTFLPQLPEWFPLRHAILLILTCLLAPFLVLRFKDTDLFIGENQPGAWLAFVASKILGKPYLIYTCHPNKMVYPRSLKREEIWKNQRDFYWLSIIFEPLKPILKYLDRVSFTSSKNPVLINGFFIGHEFEKIYKVPWISCPSGAPFLKEKNQNNVYEGEVKVGDLRIKKPYVLYVGRHEVWKRIDLAIEAFKKVVKEFPDVRFVIRGPFSNHTKTLKKLVKTLKLEDKVIFSPDGTSHKELKTLYFNASAFLFPSEKEDFGIVIIEAMGAGVPVIAWGVGGPTDIIINGKTGFLAKPYSLDDFANKVLKILKDKNLRQKMSHASWERVKSNFSWEKHWQILDREIKKALK